MTQLEAFKVLDTSYFDNLDQEYDHSFFDTGDCTSTKPGNASHFLNFMSGDSWCGAADASPLVKYEDTAQNYIPDDQDWYLKDSLDPFDSFGLGNSLMKRPSLASASSSEEESPLLFNTEMTWPEPSSANSFGFSAELESFWQGTSEEGILNQSLGGPLSPPIDFTARKSTQLSNSAPSTLSETAAPIPLSKNSSIVTPNASPSLSPADEPSFIPSESASRTLYAEKSTPQSEKVPGDCIETQAEPDCPRLESAPEPVPLISDALKSLMTTSILAHKAVEFLKRRQCLRGRKPKRSTGRKGQQLAQPPIERKRYLCSYADCLQAHVGTNCGHKLGRHVSSVHLEEHGIYCEICDKTFSRTDSLLRHQRQVHEIHLKKSEKEDEETKNAEDLSKARLFHLKEYDAICS